MTELILREIFIYPIKSLGGISCNSATIQLKGLQYDRRWMLVDADGVFMTQRIYPQMALFKLSLNNNQLTVTFRQPEAVVHPTITFNTDASSGRMLDVTIWNDKVTTVEVDERISAWFSDQLSMPCKLVNFPEDNPRPVDPLYKAHDEHVSLADAYPFLIIGQPSLDDLNARLKTPVPMNRFRPNFVFTGGLPYEEDTWKNFTIGDTRFIGVKPCARCVLITVNQDTADKGIEPLTTLSTYRKRNNKIYFGQNLVALDYPSEVRVGDQIILK